MENETLQELAKVAEFYPHRVQIVMKVMNDKEFTQIYGKEAHGRINMTVPQSVVELFADLKRTRKKK